MERIKKISGLFITGNDKASRECNTYTPVRPDSVLEAV
jgi:hypothetical protein